MKSTKVRNTVVFGGLSLLLVGFVLTSVSHAQFTFIGGVDNDFFNELNWEDGGAANPAPGSIDPSTSAAIALDLIIDGDAVVAAGQVDFGTGSLTLTAGSTLDVTGAGNDLDINASSAFSLTDATLTTNGDAVFEGTVSMSGGSITSLTDDIEFQDSISLTIDGTTFTSGSTQVTFFDGFGGGSSIANASYTTTGRLGLRNSINVVMTDTTLDINGGGSDVEDVFGSSGAGSTLTLNGTSTLLADSIEEDVALVLNGTATATLGGGGVRITADASTITLNTLDNSLTVVGPLDNLDPVYLDSRPFLINGLTGLDYDTSNGAGWNIQNWNGIDAVTLRLVPEPSSLLLASLCLAAAVAAGRRRQI